MDEHRRNETETAIAKKDMHEAVLDSIPDAILATNRDRRVVCLNSAAEKMVGVLSTAAIGRPCSTILQSSMCRDGCALQQIQKSGKSIIDAPAFIALDGRRIPVTISLALMKDASGDVIGGVEIMRDLSGLDRQSGESAQEEARPPLLTRSPLMQKVLDQLPAIAASPSTVLILGETGTGKELIAHTIHALSPHRHGPFLAVNCGAFPDTLLASELFGYKKGAFTDAKKDRAGRFAMAKLGILFLDDIEAMSPAMQVHLLRVLQEHTFEPVGATRSEKTDARVILASNEDLSTMVRKGTFRKDLYHRINVARLELPPLRSRNEDIPLLLEQMVANFNRLQGKSIQGIEPEAFAYLMAHDWPGNVRELQNAIEHAFIRCDADHIDMRHLPVEMIDQAASRAHSDNSARAIRDALERNAFNRSAAARELGIARTTLLRRMKTLRIKNGRRATHCKMSKTLR
jgi:PAS domain S-box-containing protein